MSPSSAAYFRSDSANSSRVRPLRSHSGLGGSWVALGLLLRRESNETAPLAGGLRGVVKTPLTAKDSGSRLRLSASDIGGATTSIGGMWPAISGAGIVL